MVSAGNWKVGHKDRGGGLGKRMVITVEEGQFIQAAVNAAAPGDTIVVKDGVYRESVTIGPGKDRLRILGAGPGVSILDGNGLGVVIGFSIEGSEFVTIAGFTIRGYESYGVSVVRHDNVIRNNDIAQNLAAGVYVAGSRNLVQGNTIAGNGAMGVEVAGSYNFVVTNRILGNSNAGIVVSSKSSGTMLLENEVCANSGSGVVIHTEGCWVIGNQVRDNQGEGLDVNEADNVLIYGNTTSGNGVTGMTMRATGLLALRNQINHNTQGGVLIPEDESELGLSDALFFGNEISYNASSGVLGGSTIGSTAFLKNHVDENHENGLALSGSHHNRLLSNATSANGASGISLGNSALGNLIDGNRIQGNQSSGITLEPTVTHSTVRANTLAQNRPYDLVAEPPADQGNAFEENEAGPSSPEGIND